MGRKKKGLFSGFLGGFKPEPVRKPRVPKQLDGVGGTYLYGNKVEGAKAAAKQKEHHAKVRAEIAEEREFRAKRKQAASRARTRTFAKRKTAQKKVLKKAWKSIW